MRHPLVDVFVGLLTLVSILLYALTVRADTITYTAVDEPTIEVHEVAQIELRSELKPICACESVGNRHAEPQHFHPDGRVIRGVINSDDVGMCQINLYYHEETAGKMGLDLFTEEGNITYANWLYETQGSRPWNWSAGCWNK